MGCGVDNLHLTQILNTLIVKVLASNFRVSKFFDRIQDSLFNQYVTETLSDLPMIGILKDQEEEDWMMEKVEKLHHPNEKRLRVLEVL